MDSPAHSRLAETNVKQIEAAFKEFTSREDISILLISQNVANMIRFTVDQHKKVGGSSWKGERGRMEGGGRSGNAKGGTRAWNGPHAVGLAGSCVPNLQHHTPDAMQAVPAVLEIPSKDNPYDPSADSLLVRVKHIYGAS
jgi:vacuolar-type H+-ATPase subunit F/Vma7